jgi:AraC family transcriptional regulator
MQEPSLLAGGNLPEAFEVRVRGRMAVPQATIELHDYNFHGPQRAQFESSYGFLDLALSHRPGEPRGCYVDTPERIPRPMGDVIFIPANHGLRSEWGAGAQSSICCQFGAGDLDDPDDWTVDGLEASLDVRSPFIRDALLRLRHEIETPGFCSELMAETLCIQLSIELGRYFQAVQSVPADMTYRLSAGQLHRIEEMLERPGKPPSIAELSQECGFSSRHFFRVFRGSTGMTLSEFAAERRIVRAKEMLAARKPAIKEIAWRCGFETAAAFSAAFRRVTGVSPRDYRDQMVH